MLASRGSRAAGAILKGVDVSRSDAIAGHITSGKFVQQDGNPFQIVMGKSLARKLGVAVGDRVRLMSPSGGISPSGLPPHACF